MLWANLFLDRQERLTSWIFIHSHSLDRLSILFYAKKIQQKIWQLLSLRLGQIDDLVQLSLFEDVGEQFAFEFIRRGF